MRPGNRQQRRIGALCGSIGPRGSLWFYWAADGTSTWHPEQIVGPGTMQGAPAMAAGNNTMEIAVRATDNSLRYYWSYDGTPTWYQQIRALGPFDIAPTKGYLSLRRRKQCQRPDGPENHSPRPPCSPPSAAPSTTGAHLATPLVMRGSRRAAVPADQAGIQAARSRVPAG
jgi:hypothetical protein